MKKIYSSKLSTKGKRVALAIGVLFALIMICATSCKAWRTVSTSATYVQQNDSTKTKTTTTISTKTIEEYQGHKKN